MNRLACLLAAALLSGACGCSSRRADYEQRFTQEAANEAQALKLKIEAEIAALDGSGWAGMYYHGDGMGVNVMLWIAPDSGFVFEWNGCMGLYDRNYGAVSVRGDTIRLSCTYHNDRCGFRGIADELIIVTWGDRIYLAPSDDMIGFCNEINHHAEPRKDMHGLYLLKRGDEKKAVTGFPDIPEKFTPYLLTSPIEVKIAEVYLPSTRPSRCDWNFVDIPIRLDAGQSAGLLTGMELYVIDPGGLVESVIVTNARENTSLAMMTQTDDFHNPIPEVGWKLSTRPNWYDCDDSQ